VKPAEKKPGLFRLGPFYLTPTIHVQNIGLDTNVFYTATERQTDVMASGGPGLDLVLPIRTAGRFYATGALDYLYFVRTASQRRFQGSVDTGIDLKGARTQVAADQLWGRTYGRPNYEVDQRIETYLETTRLDLRRGLFGHIYVNLGGSRSLSDITTDADYLGTDLRQTLSETAYVAKGGLEYAITVKTSFVIEGDQRWDRFTFDKARDADSNRAVGGFRTDPSALITGRALVGERWFRPIASPGVERKLTVADVDALWNITPRTRLGGSYVRDLSYSAFATTGPTPTVRTETYGVRLEKDLTSRIDLRLFARWNHFVTDGAITVEVPDQGTVVAVRDDKTREGGIDLGYRFRSRLRIGVAAKYTERNSTISYFGIDGLLFGLTVNYTP
jgi:hypothetical protein